MYERERYRCCRFLAAGFEFEAAATGFFLCDIDIVSVLSLCGALLEYYNGTSLMSSRLNYVWQMVFFSYLNYIV